LLANLAQELKKYQEAVILFSNVISNYSESEYAPRSILHKAICLEKMGNTHEASEEYVRLTYLYPKHELSKKAVLRLGNQFYKDKKWGVATRIFLAFQREHPDHKLAGKSMLLAATSQMLMMKEIQDNLKEFLKKNPKTSSQHAPRDPRNDNYSLAITIYKSYLDTYKTDSKARAEAMYWLGDAYFTTKNHIMAYKSFKNLTWDYPESKWAKIARGRLTSDALVMAEEQQR
jgi:TolA-binding protein